jgi:enoyl-CoA hydratase/carnithine racemase
MTESFEHVLYSATGPRATITINRPDRRNAINPEVIQGLAAALDRAEADASVRVAVLTGSGENAFCAGGDLGGMAGDGKVAQHQLRAEVGQLFQQMRASRLPIVARVNGHALAGGFGLMLACDLVVASSAAEFGTPEINIGLWPFMISAVIQRDVPRKVALELMLTGRRMVAEEAQRWGFINRVVDPKQLDEEVEKLVNQLTSKSTVIAALGKRSFYRVEDMAFEGAVDYLAAQLTVALESEDTLEGVTAFLEKRDPQWKDR